MHEVLAIIPARGGSKSIPKKNLSALRGKPLIQYTIDAAEASQLISRTILSSDNDEIISYCVNQGVEVPFRRPDYLAADDMPMLPVIKHAVEYLRSTEGYIPAYIVLLQPTSPLRVSRHIDEALKLLFESDTDSVVSVVEVPHCFNPYSIMRLTEGYLESFLSYDENWNLRQKKPTFYARNGAAIYAFTYECLSEKDSIYGDRIVPYMMKEEESIDIDGPFDMRIAEFLLAQRS